MLFASLAQPAAAQTAPADAASDAADTGDIIVTARKRAETALTVPVQVFAIDGADLNKRAIYSIDGVSRLVPGLISGEGGGTTQGGTIAIRGISGGDGNSFADQAVSFNIDGVMVSKSGVRRLADFDQAQIEVLKGPQALYFGGNSPGGIISIRSADPTNVFEAKVSAGYEFNAHEKVAEGYVSGPITEDLGARFAAYASHMRGWSRNVVPQGLLTSPDHKWDPKSSDLGFRGTLKYNSGGFNARLKGTYARSKTASPVAAQEFVNCPGGRPADLTQPADCTANAVNSKGAFGPNFHLADPVFPADGQPFGLNRQILASLEMSQTIGENLTLTSVSGLYRNKTVYADQLNMDYNPVTTLAGRPILILREMQQELRLESSFQGPVNFVVGGNYKSSNYDYALSLYRNAITPIYAIAFRLGQKGHAESAFGQLRWKPISILELSAGGRYSWETKRLDYVQARPTGTAPFQDYATAVPKKDWKNFSPELTASLRPNDNLNIYASYKEGFLSGGYNAGSSTIAALRGNLTYDQQTVSGFEGGIKAALLDRKLRVNLSVYDYKMRGLQVVYSLNAQQVTTNAGKEGVKGVEADFNYRTPVSGLRLFGAVAYNRARYTEYIIGCYKNQTVAQGCGAVVNGVFAPGLQDLAGAPLARAPDWSGNLGLSYDTPVSNDLELGITATTTYSGSYFTEVQNIPGGVTKRYALLDGSVRLGSPGQGWEVSLIGKNLTNHLYWTKSATQPVGSARDQSAIPSRPREVMLRFSYKFGG